MSGVHLYLNQDRFFSGDIIRGKAVCHFRDKKEVTYIRIRLKGQESTHWTRRGGNDERVDYKDQRDILIRDNIVHGEGPMVAGQHVFPFEFILPQDLPSSFLHKYGEIRYTLKLTVGRYWKTDFEDKKVITVFSPIKLEQLAFQFLQPAKYSDDSIVCGCCCIRGFIRLDLDLKRRAFVVGRNAHITAHCLNKSNKNVNHIFSKIKMKMTFKVRGLLGSTVKSDTVVIAANRSYGVRAHEEKTFNLGLEIPSSTVVPTFNGCELFSLSTELKVTAVISGCQPDIEISTWNVALAHILCPTTSSGLPVPGREAEVRTVQLPPYPVRESSPGTSVSQGIVAPPAPSKLKLGAGDSSRCESPPPTYDEAIKIS